MATEHSGVHDRDSVANARLLPPYYLIARKSLKSVKGLPSRGGCVVSQVENVIMRRAGGGEGWGNSGAGQPITVLRMSMYRGCTEHVPIRHPHTEDFPPSYRVHPVHSTRSTRHLTNHEGQQVAVLGSGTFPTERTIPHTGRPTANMRGRLVRSFGFSAPSGAQRGPGRILVDLG